MPIAKVVVVGGGGSVNSNAGEDENGRSLISSHPPRNALLTRVSHSMALIIGGDLALC